SLTLIDGARHDRTTLSIGRDPAADRVAIVEAIGAMRRELPSLPPDPYLLYATSPSSSESQRPGRLPSPEQAIDAVVGAAGEADLVGILASGPVCRGFANSLGQRNWHAVESFLFDWSIYQSGDKAIKSSFAGQDWDEAELRHRIRAARAQLPHLAQAPRTVEPGEYRAYLAPAALDEMMWMLNWGGVSAKSQRTKQSPLQRLVDGEAALSPHFTLREHAAAGLAPAFDQAGFLRPARVELIQGGEHAGALVSARTAREYGLESNGANDEESMQSMELDAGTLPESEALGALDRGIHVANLWYLNYSDRPSCRITGMTRFATFWVEHGHIVAPLNVMRFDDTLYRMLGTRLEALTRESEWIPNSGTYSQRSVETSRLPGALISGLRLTL
ncbi:MAG TPA: metallopeptidase TldD-related protein, partial [Burkholderiaceae bacterium]